MNLFSKLWADDAGVVTIEYLVLGTFLGLALIVGVTSVAAAVNAELSELANAILTFNQSYSSDGYSTCNATKTGSAAADTTQTSFITSTTVAASSIDDDVCN
jgi:Flp pilus assembly pilin Flp